MFAPSLPTSPCRDLAIRRRPLLSATEWVPTTNRIFCRPKRQFPSPLRPPPQWRAARHRRTQDTERARQSTRCSILERRKSRSALAMLRHPWRRKCPLSRRKSRPPSRHRLHPAEAADSGSYNARARSSPLALAILGAKNSDAVGAFACEKFGLRCADKRQADLKSAPCPQHRSTIQSSPRAFLIPRRSPRPLPRKPLTKEQNPRHTPLRRCSGLAFSQEHKEFDQLKDFVSQFPTSTYRPLAQIRLAALEPKVTECDLLAAHPLWTSRKIRMSPV